MGYLVHWGNVPGVQLSFIGCNGRKIFQYVPCPVPRASVSDRIQRPFPPFKLQYIAIKYFSWIFAFSPLRNASSGVAGKGSLPRRWGTSYVVWQPMQFPLSRDGAPRPPGRITDFSAHADKEQAMNAAKPALTPEQRSFSKRFSG